MPKTEIEKLQKRIKILEKGAQHAEQARAEVSALLLSIGDGVIATDERGHIKDVNPAALQLLGYKKEELIGQWYPKTVILSDERGKVMDAIHRPITQSFLQGKAVSSRAWIKKKDGTRIPVAVTVSPVMLDGRPVGAVEILRDVTQEIENDRMKSEFISIASHQLRTPLTAINVYTNMLAHGYAGDLTHQQQLLAETIRTSTMRMNELINTLLNITRLEAGKVSVSTRSTNLRTLTQNLLTELSGEANKKSITFKHHLDDVIPLIHTDPILLKEILSNLITNAIKYTPKKHAITLSIAAEKQEVIVCVRDNGYGIPKSEQGRIFTKFYRGTNITDKETVGTGLGLYLVKSLVDFLNGRIWFESEENKGTAFYVAMPIKNVIKSEGVTRLS